MIHDFVPVARAVDRIKQPEDHQLWTTSDRLLACNAPIKQLYNLGVEIEENSELDLLKHSTNMQVMRESRKL